MGDVAKLISGRWKNLTEEEKQKFKEKCEKNSTRRGKRGEPERRRRREDFEDKDKKDDNDDDDEEDAMKDGMTEAERLVQQTQMQSMMNQDKDGNSLSLPLSRVKNYEIGQIGQKLPPGTRRS